MVAPALDIRRRRPANAFAEPLRRVPRRLRLGGLVAYRVFSGFVRHNGMSWSAAMAFWLVLSLPPLLVAVSSVASAVLGPETAQAMLSDQVIAQLPAEGQLVRDLVEREIPLASVAAIGALVALLFSGSRVFSTLVTAINLIWRHVENDGLIRRELMRLTMVLLIGGMLLVSVALQLGLLGSRDEIGPVADVLARHVLPFGIVVAGLFMTYKLVPRGRATWRTAVVGALLAAVLVRAAQFVFWLLLSTVMDFEKGYGPLAGVAVLMMWAVVASAVVLLGAEFVATLDRHRIAHVPLPSSSRGEPTEQPR